MAQIQNFGFIAPVQEPHVQHQTRPCGRTWQQRGKPEGTQHALCHPYHTGADRQRSGSDIPVGNNYQQLTD